MTGTEWLDKLPNQPGADRDKMTLEAIGNGTIHCNWLEVKSSIPDHECIFFVCDDAVRADLDNGERFRPQVSALIAQKCADVLGAMLPTAKICDLAYQQATVKLDATILPANADMVTTSRSKTYNTALEKKRAGKDGLVRDCGKAWILSNRLIGMPKNWAANYGFYDAKAIYKNPSGIKMWQTIGTRHNNLHTDYSQTLIIMTNYCKLDGQMVDVSKVLTDPYLCALGSNEGVLKILRQPGA